jgi:spore photoproduct lyase
MLDGSEKELVQQVGDGSIIKRFEKTPIPQKKTDVVCPHFLELKWATGCPYDCAWCYLKGTFRFLPYRTKPHIKDFNKIKEHTQAFLEWVKEPEILNTGELADSLMFEGNKKSFVNFIVPLFENQNRHKVLFLTKSDGIQNLLRLKSHRQVIVSFSLNAIPVAQRWENKAPSVEKRIKAAKALYDKGFEVRIRIDPMVPVENWEKYYIELIDIMFSSFMPERITLGSLRGLQSTINGATDTSWTKYLSEHSNWGKKIDINLRLDMYRVIISYLREKFNKVSLCKETVAVWEILKLDYRKIKCNCIW